MLECVANVAEGRDLRSLDLLGAACGATLLDRHADPDHHRAVFTLAGPPPALEVATRSLARRAVELLDLGAHAGAHPRFGVVDVVPFVPLGPRGSPGTPPDAACPARDTFATWAADALALPCFLYGPLAGGGSRTLPEVRRRAFDDLAPDAGPPGPHPRAGACAVGARGVLVAWNLWVAEGDAALARSVAAQLRGPAVRALGFDLESGPQVSCNLVDPLTVGPADVFDRAATLLEAAGAGVARCELVGLAPGALLEATPRHRWAELALREEATIEARLESSGLLDAGP